MVNSLSLDFQLWLQKTDEGIRQALLFLAASGNKNGNLIKLKLCLIQNKTTVFDLHLHKLLSHYFVTFLDVSNALWSCKPVFLVSSTVYPSWSLRIIFYFILVFGSRFPKYKWLLSPEMSTSSISLLFVFSLRLLLHECNRPPASFPSLVLSPKIVTPFKLQMELLKVLHTILL